MCASEARFLFALGATTIAKCLLVKRIHVVYLFPMRFFSCTLRAYVPEETLRRLTAMAMHLIKSFYYSVHIRQWDNTLVYEVPILYHVHVFSCIFLFEDQPVTVFSSFIYIYIYIYIYLKFFLSYSYFTHFHTLVWIIYHIDYNCSLFNK